MVAQVMRVFEVHFFLLKTNIYVRSQMPFYERNSFKDNNKLRGELTELTTALYIEF